jgi:hypothetical protein
MVLGVLVGRPEMLLAAGIAQRETFKHCRVEVQVPFEHRISPIRLKDLVLPPSV